MKWLCLAPMLLSAALSWQGCASAPPTDRPTNPRLIPRDVLFQPPERRQVRLSPDGQYLTWIETGNAVSQLWIARPHDLERRRLVDAPSRWNVGGYEWARNGTRILYYQDRNGTGQRIYSHDVESGSELDLTPFGRGRSTIAALSSIRPDEIAVLTNARDARSYDAWRINVNSGARTLTFENKSGIEDLVFDQNLTPRIGLRHNDDGSIGAFRLTGSEIGGQLLTIPVDAERTTSFLGFDTTGRHVFVLGHRGGDKSSITRIAADQGQETIIARGGKADIHSVILNPTLGTPEAYSEHYFRDEWFATSGEIRADLRFLSEQLESDYRIIDRTRDEGQWLIFASDAAHPGTYYMYDRADRSIRELFVSRPDLRGYKLAKTHLARLTARDGLRLAAYLTLPVESDRDGDGRPERPVPMVVSVHGGPWSRSTYSFNAVTQFLANRGYAVLDVNYRGSKGYGLKSFVASYREWGGAIIRDLIDAVAWAISERIAPADKVAIYGHSFGGFATLAGLAFTPDVFRCGVEYAGTSSLFSQIETFARTGDSPYSFYRRAIGDPETASGQALLRAQSPLYAADRISKPLLIAHGMNDRTVAQREADQMVEALRVNRQAVTYLVFPDEGHNFARPENQKALRAVMEAFLAECLGGRSEPFGRAFEGSSMLVQNGAEHVPGLAELLPVRAPSPRSR